MAYDAVGYKIKHKYWLIHIYTYSIYTKIKNNYDSINKSWTISIWKRWIFIIENS